jgi:hypothetical protein
MIEVEGIHVEAIAQASPTFVNTWITAHMAAAKALGKPFIVEEVCSRRLTSRRRDRLSRLHCSGLIRH